MSEKECLDALLEVLVAEEKQFREQRIHLNGQLTHNLRMQEVLKEQLQKLVDRSTPKTKISGKLKK